ncbi:MAG TPA: DMT family transporter [Acidimicrobiales bacterium]|nr:DMT family transporter [Acidimicrobiales bacterium]
MGQVEHAGECRSTAAISAPSQARDGVRPGLAIALSVVGGGCVAGQALVNGRLGREVGTPITAALVSNGLATFLLLIAACTVPSVVVGLRRLRDARLPWWQYLGGCLAALTVAGTAYAAPILGVALFSVTQAAGTSMGGIASDRVGLGPVGKMPLAWRRVAGAALGVVAVVLAEVQVPFARVALLPLGFVLVLGINRSVQVALNGRVSRAAINVGSASLVNAVLGTAVLGVGAGLLASLGRLPFNGWHGPWWTYTGGVLALVITGANLISVRAIGVLRTGLASLTGQLSGGLVLDAVVGGTTAPTVWVAVASGVTVVAVLLSGPPRRRSGARRRLFGPPRRGAAQPER